MAKGSVNFTPIPVNTGSPVRLNQGCTWRLYILVVSPIYSCSCGIVCTEAIDLQLSEEGAYDSHHFLPPQVPRKILKEPYQGDLEPDEQPEEIPEEDSMMSPPAMPPVRRPDPPPPQSSTSYPHETKTTTIFYNPTVTTKLPEKKGERTGVFSEGCLKVTHISFVWQRIESRFCRNAVYYTVSPLLKHRRNINYSWSLLFSTVHMLKICTFVGSKSRLAPPPPPHSPKEPFLPGDNGVRDYPQDGVPRSQPDLINCTVTILSGSKNREIGFLTEWMRAVAFIKSTSATALLWKGNSSICILHRCACITYSVFYWLFVLCRLTCTLYLVISGNALSSGKSDRN